MVVAIFMIRTRWSNESYIYSMECGRVIEQVTFLQAQDILF